MGSLFAFLRWCALAAAFAIIAGIAGCGGNHTAASGRVSSGSSGDTGGSTAAQARASFVDVAAAAGLQYQWSIPGRRPLNILQTIGNGCAFLDYNNDGNLDVLLVGPRLALFQGDGHGGFTDVSRETGLSQLSGHFLGCAVGDYDNDGFDDLYICGYRGGILLHNEAGKRFRDVTRQAGISPQPWGTSCAFADIDNRGKLDLYIGNYAVYGPSSLQLCPDRGIPASCGPRNYKPIKGVLYEGDGHGHFKDITRSSGVDAVIGRTLGVAFADYDGSGLQGIAFGNDEAPGNLLKPALQNGHVHYRDVAEAAGTSYDRDGNVHGGMGLDWGDCDNDGRLDLFLATFQYETKCLYHNNGDGTFSDIGIPSGIYPTTVRNVAFGCKLFDYDNDGWLDIAIANGHVEDNIHSIDKTETYRETTQLLRNRGVIPLQFQDISAAAGPAFQEPIVGRGLAVGDFDNDGKLDLLVVDSEGKPLLLHNESTGTGHWLGIKLIGTRSNRDGYGALLTAHIGTQTRIQFCHTDGSYLSASDPRVHFGLGPATRVDTLTVKWPSGHTDTFHNVPADRYMTIREGDGGHLPA